MVSGKRHIVVDGFSHSEEFSSKSTARSPQVPLRDRGQQADFLSARYRDLLNAHQELRAHEPQPISEEIGVYVEITSLPGLKLPLEKLDNRDFRLRACIPIENECEQALVFIPESRRKAFERKIEQYLDTTKDSKKGFPRNHELIASIAEIRLAELKSFWTDHPDKFPSDQQQVVWWELWLKRTGDEDPQEIARALAERVGARLGNTSQYFFDSAVVLIRASVSQLERATELISNLEELRSAKETPMSLVGSSPREQKEQTDRLAERVRVVEETQTAICILDSGVNFHHPILSIASGEELSTCWNPEWPLYDSYNPLSQFDDHGSRQAGLAMFGDFQAAILGNDPIVISHYLESARILPPTDSNDPELYGAITVGTAHKLEADRPEWQRVYSLAVTAPVETIGGQPSSWSSDIDFAASGLLDGQQRLFVISAGNNFELGVEPEYWDQVVLAQVEDPAQSWNAVTVGAYTELTTNDDPTFDGWSPIARAGDVAPVTSSSISWGWRKQAPIKPDVVAEGGNRLISPDRTEISDAESVSLLTTSGRSTGQLLEITGDTSAATATVSHQAALLMAEYPEYWPETIRGLLVHAAEWTPRMHERFGLLHRQHSPKTAKETMLRAVGYGVTNLNRARYSANHALTLVAQNSIQPFTKNADASESTDPKLNEMRLYQLPWPIEVLQRLPPEMEVQLRITLSYFIEPNPGRRGYRQRFSYQSHGLRFEVISPGQSLDNFRAFVNGLAASDDYEGPEGDRGGWRLGPHLRKRGSIHSDTWTGAAADLANMHTIAIFPVGGWWKYRTARDRYLTPVRYSLIVSIDVPDQAVDIYSVVQNLVEITVSAEV